MFNIAHMKYLTKCYVICEITSIWQTGICVLTEVNDHTLEEKISQYIIPGTRIVADGWLAYSNLEHLKRAYLCILLLYKKGTS